MDALGEIRRPSVAQLARAAAIGGIALLWLVAMVLAAQSAAGSLNLLGTGRLAAVAIWGVLLAGLCRILWRNSGGAASLPVAIVPALALLLIGVAVTPAAESYAGIALPWTILVIGEGLQLIRVSERLPGGTWRTFRLPRLSTSPHPVAPRPLDDSRLLQQMTRVRDEDDVEVLSGRVRVELQQAERTGVSHIAFCPPFLRSPQVEASQSDGPEARVKVAEVLPQGVRLEVRLKRPADIAQSVMVTFVVRGQAFTQTDFDR